MIKTFTLITSPDVFFVGKTQYSRICAGHAMKRLRQMKKPMIRR